MLDLMKTEIELHLSDGPVDIIPHLIYIFTYEEIIKTLTKVKAWMGFEPTTSVLLVQFYTNWPINWSNLGTGHVVSSILPLPTWLDSSVGRALHKYRRARGF